MDIRSLQLIYTCAYCSKRCDGAPEYCIHRDGLEAGPQVPLCKGCGENEALSCDTIWAHLAAQRVSKTPLHLLN